MATETTATTPAGGFAGDPAQAFAPPSAGSCCGSGPAGQAAAESTGGCCGTDTAVAAGSCCGSAPVAEAATDEATSGGCCG
ncbi:hypothetical protein F1D05_28025 [Kribbella qitaiheensis]|uniref:Uncharacterized protein n=1 Tax=Kribbella qitaiheensis TaxID=1544730 RepID=A0A7G6X489_9ACTN|nr:hypothetical protein [Kribbella qitaiheensis]QNE21054.1 hypothetical protein F1D05_28025 [Kribbella qitaiheensis]